MFVDHFFSSDGDLNMITSRILLIGSLLFCVFFTPFLVKPEEFEGEQLNPDDQNSLYFVYTVRMQEDLVIRKRLKAKYRKNLHADPTKRHKAERI